MFDFLGVPGSNEEAKIYFTVVASTSQQPTLIKDAWQGNPPKQMVTFQVQKNNSVKGFAFDVHTNVRHCT